MARRHLLLTTFVMSIGGVGLAVVAPPASAAPITCQGKAVTIVADRTTTRGTEGDDVVAMEPGAWNLFDSLGGDDTVCLTAPANSPSDPFSPFGGLDTGAGDDSVVDLTPAGTPRGLTVVLGLGSDAFEGTGGGTTVYADLRVADFADPYAQPPTFTGPQADTISGAARVFSAAPLDGPNQDRISFGDVSRASLVYEGRMAPQGRVDFPVGGQARLEMRGMRRLATPAPGDVVVDNVARLIRAGTDTAFAWTGDVRTFTFGAPQRSGSEPAVSFVGTDADEGLVVMDGLVGEVAMGGGDDALDVAGLNTAHVPRQADGGAGHDSLHLQSICHELHVRLDATATCDGVTGRLSGFEEAVAEASWSSGILTLVGTSHRDRLVASAQQVRIRGRGGADEILVDDSYVTRVDGGTGRDRVSASGDDVVARGGRGADRIELQGSAGLDRVPGHHWRQLAAGGRGRDVLIGTTDTRSDRLIGGRGPDRADGRRGTRDLCRAERTKRCERR